MPVGMCRLERVEARPREQVEARLQDGGGVGRYIVSYGGGMVPMETPARIPASNDRNFVESCLMLFPVGLLVLPPAEEEQDRQRDNDAHATDTGAERCPIELHKPLDSRDWSRIRLWFACRCSVDWDVAGPFDSDAPMFL